MYMNNYYIMPYNVLYIMSPVLCVAVAGAIVWSAAWHRKDCAALDITWLVFEDVPTWFASVNSVIVLHAGGALQLNRDFSIQMRLEPKPVFPFHMYSLMI